ncbi:hypothetical protein TMatcc_002698 [Talaromyces marneffei ATCC 18224]
MSVLAVCWACNTIFTDNESASVSWIAAMLALLLLSMTLSPPRAVEVASTIGSVPLPPFTGRIP